MTRHLCSLVAFSAIALVFAGRAEAASWIFQPSSFTHDPATGKRVAQFAPKKTPYVRGDASFRQSAYRHHRSTIRVGDSADRMHIVETWGEGEAIRPYGEWQRPYREGATPYGPWGNPQGPWTTPFGSWGNPYGLGRLPYPPWPYGPYGFHHAAPPVEELPGYGEPPETE
ncbi:MAG: hypothetical protein ABIP48_17175 [Planctomycetota bacterium]